MFELVSHSEALELRERCQEFWVWSRAEQARIEQIQEELEANLATDALQPPAKPNSNTYEIVDPELRDLMNCLEGIEQESKVDHASLEHLEKLLRMDELPEAKEHKKEREERGEQAFRWLYVIFCTRLEVLDIPAGIALAAWKDFPELFGPWSTSADMVAQETADYRRSDLGYAELRVDSLQTAVQIAQRFCGYNTFVDYDSLGRSLIKRRIKQEIRNGVGRALSLRLYRLFTYAISEALAGGDVNVWQCVPPKRRVQYTFPNGEELKQRILSGEIEVDWAIDPDTAKEMLKDSEVVIVDNQLT